MSRSTPRALPDLDDTDFAAKLRPLGDSVIPKAGSSNIQISEHLDISDSARTETRQPEHVDARKSRLSVAKHIEHIEKIRGPKRRFEFLIPVRVGDALAKDAAERGQSAATRLLEVLRDAGYPAGSFDTRFSLLISP